MKWDTSDVGVHRTQDGKYSAVRANENQWVAYQMGPTTAEDLGTRQTSLEARQLCEDREIHLQSLRRRA